MAKKIVYNPALPNYLNYARNLIGIAEGNHPYLYHDTAGIATIGVGVNVVAHPDELLQELGIHPSDTRYSQLKLDLKGNSIAKFNQDIVAWGTENGKTVNPSKLLTEPQIDHLFSIVSSKREAAVDAAVGDVPQSKERAVLLSLAYQGSPIRNQGLVSAVMSGNRAAAWYAIRYTMPSVYTKKTNHTTYVQGRRYLESERFGLYDNPKSVALDEGLNVYAQMSKPGLWDAAVKYDQLNNKKRGSQGYPGHPESVKTLANELKPAADILRTTYLATAEYAKTINVAYTNIFVSQESHAGLVNTTTRLHASSASGDLIVGQGANETLLASTSRSTVIVARGENERLIGGSKFNLMIADSSSYGHTQVTKSGSSKVTGDTFTGGSNNNLIIAQGSGNTFNIDNSSQSINFVFDGDGGNTYNLIRSNETILEITCPAGTIAAKEAYAAAQNFIYDKAHTTGLLIIINGKNDTFTINNSKGSNGSFTLGLAVPGTPAPKAASVIEADGFHGYGQISQYLNGDPNYAETLLGNGSAQNQSNPQNKAYVAQSALTSSSSPLVSSDLQNIIFGSAPGEAFDNIQPDSTLIGSGGGDRFAIERGSGVISIIENDSSSSPKNTLAFGNGITADSLSVSANKLGDVVLSIGNGDSVTLSRALESAVGSAQGVQRVTFADGTSLSYAQILQEADTGSAVNTLLYGDFDANTIDSKGFATYAQGNGGGDTFFYDAGYGALEIGEVDTSDNPHNVLAFGAGIDPASVGVTADANGDLIILVSNTDQITLDNALNNADGTTYGVQKVTFADGTAWTYADLVSRAGTPSVVTSTIYGDASANVLDTHGQAHIVQGGGGGDTFVYNSGYGALTINEADTAATPNNVLRFGAGIDPSSLGVSADASGDILLNLGNGDLITLRSALDSANGATYGVQQISFANGTVWSYADLVGRAESGSVSNTRLYGGDDAATFDSKGFATYEQGGGEGDTFLYDRGYGALTINEQNNGDNASNVVTFGSGIDPSDVHVFADAEHDLILDLGNGDRITITGMLNGFTVAPSGIDKVEFSNGTVWTVTDLLRFADTGSSTNRNLFGDRYANIFDGNGYATFEQGGGGGDTFIYNHGDGALTINEIDGYASPDNVLNLGAGIDPADVSVAIDRQGDIILNLGGSDVITLKGMAASARAGVQSVHFANGITWDAAQIIASVNGGTLTLDPNAAEAVIGSGYYSTGAYGVRDIDVSAPAPQSVQTVAINGSSQFYQVSVVPGSNDILVTNYDGEGIRLVGALADGECSIPSINFSDGTTWTYTQLAQMLQTPGMSGAPGLFGDSGANTLDTQGRTSFAQGGGGGDTFIYNVGYGALEIGEADSVANPSNILSFGAGIEPSAVVVSADDNGSIVLNLGNGDQVTLDKALNSVTGATYGVQQIHFADGTSWTYADMLQKLENPVAGASGIYGDDQANILDTQSIVGFVQGGGGGDTFAYNSGYGALEISESDSSTSPHNVLAFGSGIDPSQVTVTSDGSGNIFLNLGGLDQVKLDNALSSDNGVSYGVQQVTFANGTVWTAAQLTAFANAASNDSSTLTGTNGADVLDSGGTASYVQGNGGGDTFKYERGYGALEINEADTAVTPNNVLSFGVGIDPTQVVMSSDGDGNVILDLGGSDQITLDKALSSGNGTTWGVQQVFFADGTTWSYGDILAKLETATGARALDVGTMPGSVLDGGGTATYAFGKGGGDTFVYNQGYGQLTISEADHAVSPDNALEFGSDIAPSDISVSANANGDILLSIDDGDEVILQNALNSGGGTSYGVQSVTFVDGTRGTYADLLAQVESGVANIAGVYGDRAANVLDAQGLTNYAQGNGGGDTFVYNSGYGTLEINERDTAASPANILAFGAGIRPSDVNVSSDANGDLVIALSSTDQVIIDNTLVSSGGVTWGVQQVTFADGTHWSLSDLLSQLAAAPSSMAAIGTSGADVLDASGKNYLVGRGGGDTFTYATGDGYVTIDESDTAEAPDNNLVFGPGVLASAVTVSANDAGDILLSLSSTDVVVLRNALGSANGATYGVQQVHFADGTSWTYADLLTKVATASASADGIYGDAGANTLDTQDLVAYARGGGGGDTFVYQRGYGALAIDEADTASSPDNILAFGAGIDPSAVVITSDSAGNILLSLGGSDEITIDNAFNSGNGTSYGVQHVTFQNGTSWSLADLIAKATIQASGGIYGDAGANTLDTHGLANYAQGGGGGDTFVYDSKYGALEIDEEDLSASPDNVLAFGSGISASSVSVSGDENGNLVLSLGGSDRITLDSALNSDADTSYGVQRVTFQDGTSLSYAQLVAEAATGSANNDSIYGDGGANILDSKGFASYAAGNGGGDTFVYNRGYGALAIDEQDSSTGPANVLAFGAGIDPSQIAVTADADGNLILSLGGSDQITLSNALNSSGGIIYGVQQVTFADGTSWSYADLLTRADSASPGTIGLYGDKGANLLDTQGLTHFAEGGGGGDTFVYNSGYGALEIAEEDGAANPSNVLAFGAGVDPSQIKVTADANGDLILNLGGSNQITIDNALKSGGGTADGVQAVSFATGTRWSYADLLAMADTASANNASLYGDAGANLLDSKGVATLEQGNGGGDTFIYNRGYGALTIDEVDTSGSDNAVAFGNGIDPSNVTVSIDVHSNVLLDLGNGDLITLKDGAPGGDAAGALSVSFANGQTWTAAQLTGLATGSIDFTPGSGTLVLDLSADPIANVPAIVVGAGLLATDFSVSAGGNSNADLILTADNGDQIVLRNALTATTAASEAIHFSDGTSWTYAQMLSDLETGAVSSNGVYGDATANTLDSKGLVPYAQGNGGGDSFIYNSGYGALEINEVDSATNPHNTLVFGAGILPSQVAVTGNANSALILSLGNGDRVTLDKALESEAGTSYGVHQVNFADGTIWTYADLLNRASNGSADTGAAYGDGNANTLDTHGYSSVGQGSGYVQGGGGGDTIIYNAGYGTVEVNEVDTGANPHNVLAFGAGISASEVSVGNDYHGGLTLTVNDGNSNDRVVLDSALNSGSDKTYGVQSVSFADGTIWSSSDLLKKAETGSSSNRSLQGGTGADTFDTAGWATSVNGEGGSDSILYDIGYGIVNVDEEDSAPNPMNVLKFGADIDPSKVTVSWTDSGNIDLSINEGGSYDRDQVILENALETSKTTAYGVQEVDFANGTKWDFEDILAQANAGSGSLIGDGTVNILDTQGHIDYNRGHGYAQGGGGGDTFVFNTGYGLLEIKEIDVETTPDNILQFGTGIAPSGVTVSGDSSGNLILDLGNGDQVRLDSALLNGGGKTYGVQGVSFTDGTHWSYQDLLARVETPTSGDTSISGDSGANLLDAQGLVGEAIGNGGGDTFIYKPGYGDLTIDESDTTGNPHNALRFGAGIAASDVTVTANGAGDLLLNVAGSGTITLAGGINLNLGAMTNGVQQVAFVDGTSWSYADLMKLADTGSSANTVLYGDQRPELFDSRGYATTEYGRSGNDEFLYNQGYGNLTVDETGGSGTPDSVLSFGSGITLADISVSANASGDMTLTVNGQAQIDIAGEFAGGSQGVQKITFAGGGSLSETDLKDLADVGSAANTRLYGTDAAESFDSAGFATYIHGGGGADTFLYKPGYGALEIDEQSDSYTRIDAKLQFGTGISESAVETHLTSNGNLVVTDGIAGDQITIDKFGQNDLSNSDADRNGVGSIAFSDGSSLSQQQLLELALTPTASNGIIYGSSGNDVLPGGTNARFEDGLGGNDTYAYHAGDGALEIGNDGGNSFSNDILRLGAGIDASNLEVRADASGNIIMTDGVTGDSITIDGMDEVNYAGYTPGLHEVDFADGSTLTARQIVAMTMIGSPTNTMIFGSPQADLIDGKGFATVEYGGGGADTFIYKPGYGQLEINEVANGTAAIVQVGDALTVSDFTASFDSTGDVTLTDGISGDLIKLDKEIVYTTIFGTFGYNPDGVAAIDFADGSSITQANLMQQAVTGSSSNLRLYGANKSETFDSRGYATYAQGVSGADRFLYQSGYGAFEINENAGFGRANNSTLAFGGAITPANISVKGNADGSIVITDGTSGDAIKLGTPINPGAIGPEMIQCA